MSADEVLAITTTSACGPVSLTRSKAIPSQAPPTSPNYWVSSHPRCLWKLLCRWFTWEVIPGSRSGGSEKPVPVCVNKLASAETWLMTPCLPREPYEMRVRTVHFEQQKGEAFFLWLLPLIDQGWLHRSWLPHAIGWLHVRECRVSYTSLLENPGPGSQRPVEGARPVSISLITQVWSWLKLVWNWLLQQE